jgi:predicted SnoaL-like aldol condensation-catalyzing enzyme
MMDTVLETNKKNVAEFYDLLLNKKDFAAANRFMGKRYKQHNPLVKDGPEGLREFVEARKANHPDARSEIKRIFAEGDYVILHVHSILNEQIQRAIIEIFRLEDGKIDEHWDVIQPIPEESANPNGMF